MLSTSHSTCEPWLGFLNCWCSLDHDFCNKQRIHDTFPFVCPFFTFLHWGGFVNLGLNPLLLLRTSHGTICINLIEYVTEDTLKLIQQRCIKEKMMWPACFLFWGSNASKNMSETWVSCSELEEKSDLWVFVGWNRAFAVHAASVHSWIETPWLRFLGYKNNMVSQCTMKPEFCRIKWKVSLSNHLNCFLELFLMKYTLGIDENMCK